MSRITVAPEECECCGLRMVEPDAEPYGDWTWRCNNCGYTTFEAPDRDDAQQRAWSRYFAQTRPRERADWIEAYHLVPEKSLA